MLAKSLSSTNLECSRMADGYGCKDLRAGPTLDTCKPQHNELCRFVLTEAPAMSNLSEICKLELLAKARKF